MIFSFINKILKFLNISDLIPEDKSFLDFVTDFFSNNGFTILVIITTVYVFQQIIRKLFIYSFIIILIITISSKPKVKKKIISIFKDNTDQPKVGSTFSNAEPAVT
jgi:hypothetical protein